MTQWIRQTNEVTKLNLRQLVLFEILYRVAAGTFYIRLVSWMLRFSLRMAGYSYLTVSNMGAFLLRPLTILCFLLALCLGMGLMLFEIGGLLTSFQAAAYSRRINILTIFRGALIKIRDEWGRRNWQLLPLALVNYLMMNSFLIFRLLSRIKPFDFIMYEILHSPPARLFLVVLTVGMVFAGIPTMLVFFACMVEQKAFWDGVRRSILLLKKRWLYAIVLLILVNLLLTAVLILIYIVFVVISAILVTMFADNYAAAAVLAAVCTRIELGVLFFGSMMAVILNFGALTVLYYQFDRKQMKAAAWDFSPPHKKYLRRGHGLILTAVLTGTCCFLIFDMVYNGLPSDWLPLGQTEITAHRGSSGKAPENTMAALEAAMDEMADYSEIDVQITSDGVVVLCHDLNLKRLAGIDKKLGDMTFEELQELDVGSHFSADFAGEKIPALEDVLAACKGRMKLNIELKDLGSRSRLPEKTAELVKEYGMEEQCVITSVSLDYLKRVKVFDTDLRTGYILAAAYGRYYENEWIDLISIRSSFVTKRLIEAAHEHGKAVHVWTVNGTAEIEQMKLIGADNIITDYPARAREILYREAGTEGLMEYLRMMIK